jgi:ABC-2 type transport system ATP-binding protein
MFEMTRDTGGDAIRLDAIVKSFSGTFDVLRGRHGCRAVQVLRDVTLRVSEGEIMGLVGANGAGKTTLLEILSTVQLPTAGRAFVGGYDVLRESMDVRKVIGYCPTGSGGFHPTLTGEANLEFFGALVGLSPRAATGRAEAVLEMVGGSDLRRVMFQRFSAGMRQKLALARALLANPPILLLDEPTRSLDHSARSDIHTLLRHVLVGAMRKTVLLVTHDTGEVHALCDRVALLRHGRIARVGTPEEIAFGDSQESRAARFSGWSGLDALYGCEPVET